MRDLYELDLLWEFVIQKKPVFGICCGIQLINVAMGGTLFQDIGEIRPGSIAHVDSDRYDELHHFVAFEPRTRLAQLGLRRIPAERRGKNYPSAWKNYRSS